MIIGLTGLSGSGKDTAANWLVENKGFERRAFADPLRNLLFHMDPKVATREGTVLHLQDIVEREGSWSRAQLVHPQVRRLLQTFATDFIRNKVDEDFWVKLSLYDIDPFVNLVFSDVRFMNELQALKKIGGVIVNIKSPLAEVNRMGHVSENVELLFDRQIKNSGTLQEFHLGLGSLVESLGI